MHHKLKPWGGAQPRSERSSKLLVSSFSFISPSILCHLFLLHPLYFSHTVPLFSENAISSSRRSDQQCILVHSEYQNTFSSINIYKFLLKINKAFKPRFQHQWFTRAEGTNTSMIWQYQKLGELVPSAPLPPSPGSSAYGQNNKLNSMGRLHRISLQYTRKRTVLQPGNTK